MNAFYRTKPPRSRINITLDLESEGAKKKKELPLRLLVLGQFSEKDHATPISHREKINVTKNNIDLVMDKLTPATSLRVPNHLTASGGELGIHLQFHRLVDFGPDHLIQQIPEMKRLMAMRNLLKDLRANIIDNKQFKLLLDKIVQDPLSVKRLGRELKALSHQEGDSL